MLFIEKPVFIDLPMCDKLYGFTSYPHHSGIWGSMCKRVSVIMVSWLPTATKEWSTSL